MINLSEIFLNEIHNEIKYKEQQLLSIEFPNGLKDMPNEFIAYRWLVRSFDALEHGRIFNIMSDKNGDVGYHFTLNKKISEKFLKSIVGESIFKYLQLNKESFSVALVLLTCKINSKFVDIAGTAEYRVWFPNEMEITLKENCHPDIIKIDKYKFSILEDKKWHFKKLNDDSDEFEINKKKLSDSEYRIKNFKWNNLALDKI